MNMKKLVVSTLAGVMIIGSIGVYANSNSAKQVGNTQSAYKVENGKEFKLTEEEEKELEKMKIMSQEELLEYIEEHNPRVMPPLKTTAASESKNFKSSNTTTGSTMPASESENPQESKLTKEDKEALEKMKKMSQEELLEYIKKHNPKLVPVIESAPVKK
ncbi:hypothetical protein R9X47_10150 [Wukongibacter baidiensis]|uniref:hypothetical protein n=1 Tax=Wukongibacter baidiensis TaxID=1723361 RepID=UPI003D7F996B